MTIDNDKMSELITLAVQKAFKEAHPNRCPIPDEAQQEIGHFFGAIKDLGEGDYRKGIETLRNDHRFISEMQKVRNKIGSVFLGLITITVTGAFLTWLWKGFISGLVPNK